MMQACSCCRRKLAADEAVFQVLTKKGFPRYRYVCSGCESKCAERLPPQPCEACGRPLIDFCNVRARKARTCSDFCRHKVENRRHRRKMAAKKAAALGRESQMVGAHSHVDSVKG
jgi:hypothetical protein